MTEDNFKVKKIISEKNSDIKLGAELHRADKTENLNKVIEITKKGGCK